MHALPVALPALLPGMIATESAKLKLQLNASVSDQLRESLSWSEIKCYACLHFDARGAFKCLTAHLDRTSPEDFEVQISWSTFAMVHYDLEKAVVREWLVRAVARRLKRGRELAHLDDDALQAISARCRSHFGSAQLSTMHLQEAFLGRLAVAETAERERDGSKHQRLHAIKQAKPLLQLLDAESADAEREDAPHLKARAHVHDDVAGNVPEETRRIYAYRAYHDGRREGFPLFNGWCEPWPKRGRLKRAAADGEEVAKAG